MREALIDQTVCGNKGGTDRSVCVRERVLRVCSVFVFVPMYVCVCVCVCE